MLLLRKPSADTIQHFLSGQSKLDFTYTAVGSTIAKIPSGFIVDHTRVKIGSGEDVFEAAKSALRRWDHFRLGWLEACHGTTPIQKGDVVAIVANTFGLWWLNACRIIFVIDDTGATARFGFAYGTLPGHAAIGEERFLLEWDHSDNSVWYDILAFSRPNHLLARQGYPMVRRIQKRFGQESSDAMRRAVNAVSQPVSPRDRSRLD